MKLLFDLKEDDNYNTLRLPNPEAYYYEKVYDEYLPIQKIKEMDIYEEMQNTTDKNRIEFLNNISL